MAMAMFKFEEFELDRARYQLRRAGRNLKLEKIPMELLILLVAKNGHLVTRPEIVKRLWSDQVFVDTEHGINTAIRKIRQVLRDDPERPRFVETVTGKGYRFIAPVTEISEPSANDSGTLQIVNSPDAVSSSDSGSIGAQAAKMDPAEQDTAAETNSLRNRKKTFRIAALGTVAVIGLIVVTIIGWNARGWRDRFQSRTTKPRIAALAVLPLENLSGDPGQDYLAAGLTDELITMLAKNSTLRIISRTSVMQYKGVHRPLRDIARELGVDGILEGSVARTETRVHMTIQLIHAPSDTHVWAESYDRNVDTIVSLPRDTAQTIAKQLNSAAASVRPQRLINPEAHDAYLRGRYYWISFKTSKAGEYFKKAVELQPDYALGWSGLSDFYGRSAMTGAGPPRELVLQLTAAASKALELDDSLAEAHNSAAAGYLFNWNWERADMESARAVELHPDFAEAHHLRSYVLAARNRMDEALEEQKRSTELDPLLRPWAMGRMFMRMRQFDAALNDARLRVAAQPEIRSLRDLLSDAYWYKGMEKEAVQELEEQQLLDGDKATAAAVRRAFQQGGYKAVLELQVSRMKQSARKQYVSPLFFAYVYGRLGLREETLHFLEEAFKEASPRLVLIQTEPDFDFIHSDERYRAIVRGMGLPPAF